jgi:glycerophosphoryl diester phosphodiesterase
VTSTLRVLAHRGAHDAHTHENTIAAFERAVALGADGCELDVRRSADGELVIFHDYGVGREPISSLSASAISSRVGYPLPLLADVLEWAGDRVALDIELKEDGYVEQVAPLLDAFAAAGGSLLVTSFIDPVLERLGSIAPGLRRGLLIGMSAIGAVSRARKCHADAIVLQAKLASERVVAEACAVGLEILVWDVLATGDGHSRFIADLRVAGVITDDLEWALAERSAVR